MALPRGMVEAVYRDTGVPEYQGNPLIEALPQILSKKQVGESLVGKISFEPKDIFIDGPRRAHRIALILGDFFLPLSVHLRLEERISIMIRTGYLGRNLRDGSLNSHMQNGYERIMTGNWEAIRFKQAKSTALSLSLIGCSGSGKSTTVRRILETYPQAIFHEEFNFRQITYLKIDCPHDGSLKSLCINFFRAVDAVLHCNYERRYALKRHSIEDLVGLMSQVANLHAIGVLVIDEIQHLSLKRSGGVAKMLNFFVNLVNVIGLPVIMVGTPKATPIFVSDLRSARRSAGFGALFWDNMKQGAPGEIGEWTDFTNKLWKNQLLQRREEILSDDLRDLWYDLSQGVLDIVVKLFVLSQIRAIVTGGERINTKLMKVVYDEELAPVHPMLEALRSGDPERIARYSDLKVYDFEKRLLDLQVEMEPSVWENYAHPVERTFHGTEKEEHLYNILKSIEVDTQLVSVAVKRSCELHPAKDVRELLPIALEMCKKPDRKNTKKTVSSRSIKRKEWHSLETEDLRYKFSQLSDDETMYQQLQKSHLVFDVEQWLEQTG